MSDGIRKKIIYIFFGLSVLYLFYNTRDNEPDRKANSPLSQESQFVVLDTNIKQTDIIDIEEKSNEEWGRNPFRFDHTAVKMIASAPRENKVWKLSGIVYNNASPIAIINKKPVKIGETINNAKVIKINKENVIINYQGSEIVLNVSKG